LAANEVYMQKETWENDISGIDDIGNDLYDDIEAIYKEYQEDNDWAEPNEKNGNCLCVNCCKDISDGEAFFAINVTCMECQKCGHLKHSDDVEYVPEFPNSQDDEFELDRDFCFKCAQIVRADNPEYDSTSDANSDDRDEGGANDLALGDAANGAGARSPFA
jgi:hypothetical protein